MKGFANELNADQLNKLADLFFDLAKAAFVLAFISPSGSSKALFALLEVSKGITLGLAFTYSGLILLKIKAVKRL